MEFKNLFENYKEQIKKHLKTEILLNKKEFLKSSNVNPNIFDSLDSFVTKGKMLRGSMALLAAEAYGAKIENDLLAISSSLELMHSALLIHDDIMDNDELRRGEKTIFATYKEYALKTNLKNPEHFGISMGIIIGDIALFMAEELTSKCEINLKEILKFYTKELKTVGVGQLSDYTFGVMNEEITSSEILNIYINKSARYSFSLPLVLGAIYAGVDNVERRKIEVIGEKIGLIFQLIDDDLGMFGSFEDIGKVVGSDIRENKKTLLRIKLFEKLKDTEKDEVLRLFGKSDLSELDIKKIRDLIINYGIRHEISMLIDKISHEAKSKINDLEIQEEYKKVFLELLEYNLKRHN